MLARSACAELLSDRSARAEPAASRLYPLGCKPDFSTRDGARDLADAINDYWRARGIEAKARVARGQDENGCALFGIRSDLKLDAAAAPQRGGKHAV